MVRSLSTIIILLVAATLTGVGATNASAQSLGGIRGVVYDQDFEAPLVDATVLIAETGESVKSNEQGTYIFREAAPGQFTLVFSKDGFTRQIKANVIVQPGRITDVDVYLAGEFEEMDEVIVQDLEIGGSSEIGLLTLRADAPALIDSVGAALMSQAGAGDAAAALRLVTGATVQDGKFAVIRGLPDRFVSSQMNGVRLPSADEDTRAVELDQFPSSVIESLQVSKTFTPDQQGDASGGAVNVVLLGIPAEDGISLDFGVGTKVNTNSLGRDDFLSYHGGGTGFLGRDGLEDHPSPAGVFGESFGTTGRDTPMNYDMDMTFGAGHTFDSGLRVGGFAGIFYERDGSFHENAKDHKWWRSSGGRMTPQYIQGTPTQGDFKTQLFDVTKGSQETKYGGLAALGLEYEMHALRVIYMNTQAVQDSATLAEDKLGKQVFFPGYRVSDPTSPGYGDTFAAPYLRNETLSYEERSSETIQFSGNHTLPEMGLRLFNGNITFREPELDWTYASSTATRFNHKRQFGSLWIPRQERIFPGFPPIVTEATHYPFKAAENFTIGNAQLIFKDIEEESDQYFVNLKFPFEQWDGEEGYFKVGVFDDQVTRTFDQDTFSNLNNNSLLYEADFNASFSNRFQDLPTAGPISAGPPFVDVDYVGKQHISAGYIMSDLPVTPYLNLVGGVRLESTDITIKNTPEADATWVPLNSPTIVQLTPGDADADFQQEDMLPSIGFNLVPHEMVTIRGSYTETVARQTFKELSPIQQQEFLGGDVFIGNPDLKMAAVDNWDIRGDLAPQEGTLFSASYFYKSIEDPIEYVQQNAGFSFTRPVNFPKGVLHGFELEARHSLGYSLEDWLSSLFDSRFGTGIRKWGPLKEHIDDGRGHRGDPSVGLSIGANATFISSEVELSATESARFNNPTVRAPQTTRDMTNAPEHLYNLFLTYNLEETGTQFGIFYTVKGDTLIAGAGTGQGNLIPDVYQLETDTLNVSVSQKFMDHFKIKFSAKNLIDPVIRTAYRSDYMDDDFTKTEFRKGIDLSISISAQFNF